MKKFKRTAVMPYTPEQMFDVISDVAEYDKFLPGCRNTRVVSQDGPELVVFMELSRGGLSRRFTTRNQLQKPDSIIIEQVEGPLEKLSGKWDFTPFGDNGCKMQVELDITFANFIAGKAFSLMFNQASTKLVDAFRKRAEMLYGRPVKEGADQATSDSR